MPIWPLRSVNLNRPGRRNLVISHRTRRVRLEQLVFRRGMISGSACLQPKSPPSDIARHVDALSDAHGRSTDDRLIGSVADELLLGVSHWVSKADSVPVREYSLAVQGGSHRKFIPGRTFRHYSHQPPLSKCIFAPPVREQLLLLPRGAQAWARRLLRAGCCHRRSLRHGHVFP